MDILLKRGLETNRDGFTPNNGEPIFTTDDKELFIGDGTTPGGIPVGTIKPTGSILEDMLALFSDATGKILKGVSKAEFLQDYATEAYVNQTINDDVASIKVDEAVNADTAANAVLLNGEDDYLRPTVITQSFQEDDSNKVGSAAALKALYDTLVTSISGVDAAKIDTSAISNSVTSTSTSTVASSLAVKTANDKINDAEANALEAKTLATTANSKAQQAINKANSVEADAILIEATADTAKATADTNAAQLAQLPNSITYGTADPSGGQNGDVYIQYK